MNLKETLFGTPEEKTAQQIVRRLEHSYHLKSRQLNFLENSKKISHKLRIRQFFIIGGMALLLATGGATLAILISQK